MRGFGGLRKFVLCASVALWPVLASPGAQAEASAEDLESMLRELQRTVAEQQKRIAAQEERLSEAEARLKERESLLSWQQELIDGQTERLKGLSREVESLSARFFDEYGTVTYTPRTGFENAVYRGEPGGVSLAQTAPQAPSPVPPKAPVPPAEAQPEAQPEEGVGEAAEEMRPESEAPREELLVESGAVLLPAGTLQLEPSFDYSHVSTDRVAISGFTIFEAIVIGLIRVDEVERDTLTAALSARYGVTDRFQVEARVPYVYRSDSELLGVGTNQESELSIDGNDIGDVELAGSYQVLTQEGAIPGTILRLRSRFPTGTSAFDIDTQLVDVAGTMQQRLSETPTGSGFYAVAPGATFVWRADPVAFFTGGSYTFNLKDDQEGFGEIDPGDTIEYFAGMNIALSEKVGINFSFVNQITGETEQDGVEQNGTDINDARLSLGTSVALLPNMSLLVTASAGLTDESPDYSFVVSLPINFNLF